MYFLYCWCLVAKSRPTPCECMDCSTPGFSVLPCLLEFIQTHVLWVSDAVQPSHLLLPSSPALSLSQHQDLFQWVGSFTSSGQGIGASASTPVLPMNIQGWYPLGLTGLISLQSKGLSRVPAPQFKCINSMVLILLYGRTQLLHPYMTSGKTIGLTVWTFISKVISLLFNTLSRFVIAFLQRSMHLLISWLQSPSAVILEPKKIKSVTVSTLPPSICHEVMGSYALVLDFRMLSFTLLFHPHQDAL